MFRLVTWNVLAPSFAAPERYPYIDPVILDAPTRLSAQLEWLLTSPADIICLQEATWDLVEPLTAALGSDHVLWLPRQFRRSDGLALVLGPDVISANYEELTLPSSRDRDRVAQIIDLRVADRSLALANVHLTWPDPAQATAQAAASIQLRTTLTALGRRFADAQLLVGDVNAATTHPVRLALVDAGFTELQGSGPTAYVNGDPKTRDVVAARSLAGTVSLPLGDALGPLPSLACASDHVPLLATLDF